MIYAELRTNKDFLAGLVFILIGVLAVAVAGDYPIGTAMRIGPAYFPTAFILVVIIATAVRGKRARDTHG